MASRGYLRFPHVQGDTLTFVADDDVWLASLAGGRAWRVSSDHAKASYPRLSPDGTSLAWTTWRDGAPEVRRCEIEDGQSRRVTYWGDGGTRVAGWTPGGEILALTGWGSHSSVSPGPTSCPPRERPGARSLAPSPILR